MSRKEILNKDIDLAAKLLHFFLVSLFGVGAYVFINSRTLGIFEILLALFCAVCLGIAIFISVKQYLKIRKELEKL